MNERAIYAAGGSEPTEPAHERYDFKRLERMLREEKHRLFCMGIEFDKADVVAVVKEWLGETGK